MRSDSTPSLVYGLTSAVAAVTIESMGVTPPCRGRVEGCSFYAARGGPSNMHHINS